MSEKCCKISKCDCTGFVKAGVFAKKTCKNCKHKLEDHIIINSEENKQPQENKSTPLIKENQTLPNLNLNNQPLVQQPSNNSPKESPKTKVDPNNPLLFTPRTIERRRTITGSLSGNMPSKSEENLLKTLNNENLKSKSPSLSKSSLTNNENIPNEKTNNNNPPINNTNININNVNATHMLEKLANIEKGQHSFDKIETLRDSNNKNQARPSLIQASTNPKLIDKMRTLSQKFNKVKMQELQNMMEDDNQIPSSSNHSNVMLTKNLEIRKIIAKKEEEKKMLKKSKKERTLEPQELHMEWLLEKVLRGLNVDESSTKVIVKKVVQTALRKRPMEPFAVLSLFNSILDKTTDVMTSMTCGSEIIKIQSLVRRYLAIKKFKPKIEYWRNYQERLSFYHSLLKSETIFNKNLDIVIACYIEPLIKYEKSNKLPISQENMKKIFGNFTVVVQVHSIFLHELYKLKLGWPYIDDIGKSLRVLLERIEEIYDEYSKNFCYSIDTLTLCIKESDKFASFISDVQNVTQTRAITDMDLKALLHLPLTRIQQYNFVIQDLCGNTPKEHKDYQDLTVCRNIIRKLRKTTTDNVNEHQTHSKSLLIQERLLLLDEIEELRSENTFIIEGFLDEAQEGEKPQKRYLFLFTGALIVTKINNKKYKLKDRIESDDLSVQSLPDVNTRKNYLKIGKLTFIAKSAEDKQHWVDTISKIVSVRILKEMVFGAPLEVVLRREKRLQSGIPKVVQDCIEILKKDPNNLATDGIFRVTGNSIITQQMQHMVDFDKGKCSYNLESLKPGVHELTTITKLYLRELPVPAIPFQFYDTFVEIGKNQITGREFINKMAPELAKFPAENRKLLSYLLHFLHLVGSYSEKNRMKLHNLGIVFGPTLLRPQVQTIDNSFQFDSVTHVVEHLIENCSQLFPYDKPENSLSDDDQNESTKSENNYTTSLLTEEEVKHIERKHSILSSDLYLESPKGSPFRKQEKALKHSSVKLINLQEFGKTIRKGFSKNEFSELIRSPEEKNSILSLPCLSVDENANSDKSGKSSPKEVKEKVSDAVNDSPVKEMQTPQIISKPQEVKDPSPSLPKVKEDKDIKEDKKDDNNNKTTHTKNNSVTYVPFQKKPKKNISSIENDEDEDDEGSLIPEINRLTIGVEQDDDDSDISSYYSGEEVIQTVDRGSVLVSDNKTEEKK
eukprot:TRINITY_DN6320_c1_g2_i1.p1 TRINITY_DN6320_c1_g2~~TRINITY_DN6320_c1_g2_i1.p1  ORF type:complete len:1182 (-),score=330.26 TRINITY_DN6320_c1_g2_i1:72-3617(-)